MDLMFWSVGLLYTASCGAMVLTFLANTDTRDELNLLLTSASVVLSIFLVSPMNMAFVVAAILGCVKCANPRFARGDPQLGFVLAAKVEVHPKAKELAHRAITVGDLLDFYGSLPEVMPQFDPDRATTSDVVRQAVIPLSWNRDPEGEGVAYATLVANGESRLASVMVTHNWSNKFAFLLAAIFGDALGMQEFQPALDLMTQPGGLDRLRHALRGVLHKTYWVCAFCVNQHGAICGRSRQTEDSMGEPIWPCRCATEKYQSGDLCEMNKFDDMMAYLSCEVPGFAQVVAIDAGWMLFSRIWCVAELLEARRRRLPQALMLKSQAWLNENRELLTIYDVREAKASRSEDRDFILGKIDDPDEFNSAMKDLILHSNRGLLAAWIAAAGLSVNPTLIEEILVDIAGEAIVANGR
jgi:hypothetical protein